MKQALRNIARLPRQAKVEYGFILLAVFAVAWSLAAILGPSVQAALRAEVACGHIC